MKKILDIGCGNGRDLCLIARTGAVCVGIDSSSKMINEAEKELKDQSINRVTLKVGDVTSLEFPDEFFDKILCSEVIEHIPNYQKAISEMYRVLKLSGCLIISTPNRHSIYGFDRYILIEKILKREWSHPYDSWKTPKELFDVLESEGLIIDKFIGVCYIPGFLISYRLPKLLKYLLVSVTTIFEYFLSRFLPKRGYMIAIKATKKS